MHTRVKQLENSMQDKQKVTFYLSPELHRQLKVRSAMDSEPMSDIAERAIYFYLAHADVVEATESHGGTHRVYNCPECAEALVIRNGEMVPIGNQPAILSDELTVPARQYVIADSERDEQEVLVPC